MSLELYLRLQAPYHCCGASNFDNDYLHLLFQFARMPPKKQKPLPPDYLDQIMAIDPPRCEVPGDDGAAGMIQALISSNSRLSAQVAACDARAFVEMERARVLEMRLATALSDHMANASVSQAIISAHANTIQSLVVDVDRLQCELAQWVAQPPAVSIPQLQHLFDQLQYLLSCQEVGVRRAAVAAGDHRAVEMGRFGAADHDVRVIGQRGSGSGQFLFPQYVAFDVAGNIVVSDSGNDRIQVMQYSDGVHLRSFGCKGSGNGQFNCPAGIAFDCLGHIVVADCDNHRVQVLKYRDGSHVRSIGCRGTATGQLKHPSGVAIDFYGNIVVHDGYSNGRIQIFQLSDGVPMRSFCNWGCGNAQLQGWGCLAFDDAGNLVVSDSRSSRIQVLRYADGTHIRTIGKFGSDNGQFRCPLGVASSSSGELFVADSSNHRVQVLNYRDGLPMRNIGCEGCGVGQLQRPCGIVLDGDRGIVVCDTNNGRVCVFR